MWVSLSLSLCRVSCGGGGLIWFIFFEQQKMRFTKPKLTMPVTVPAAMSDVEEPQFEQADAGASKTYPMQVMWILS